MTPHREQRLRHAPVRDLSYDELRAALRLRMLDRRLYEVERKRRFARYDQRGATSLRVKSGAA